MSCEKHEWQTKHWKGSSSYLCCRRCSYLPSVEGTMARAERAEALVLELHRENGDLRARVAELEAVVLRQKGEVTFAQNEREIMRTVAQESGRHRARVAELESKARGLLEALPPRWTALDAAMILDDAIRWPMSEDT